MAVSPLRSCTIVLRFDSSGRLDPGRSYAKQSLRINDRLSELDELILKYARPIGVFRNVNPLYTPEIGPGRFLRLNRGG